MSREAIMAFLDERKDKPMLEIGPFYSPFLTRDKYNVFYADIQDKDGIYLEYLPHKLMPPEELYDKIVPIDYVITNSYKKTIADNKFGVVFSSHVLEHVDDVIAHLLDLSEILTDDGCVAMVIPDKRYCFDHFREVTPFRDMLDVYLHNDIRSTARLIFDSQFNSHPCNDPMKYTKNAVSFSVVAENIQRYTKALAEYRDVLDNGTKKSLHYWVFTYDSFLGFLRDGLRANLLPYTLHFSQPPVDCRQEFTVILKKDLSILRDDSKRNEEIQIITDLIETSEIQNDISYNNALKIQYDAIINSTSWKITSPLRFGKRLWKKTTKMLFSLHK